MLRDQSFVPPTIVFASNLQIKHNNIAIDDQANENTTSYDKLDKNKSGRNAETITAITQIIPEKQEPSSIILTSRTMIKEVTFSGMSPRKKSKLGILLL